MNPTTHATKEINKCFKNATKRLWECQTIEQVENMEKTPQERSPHRGNSMLQGSSDLPNPNKTREQKIDELEDHYSNVLYDKTDEEIDLEYNEKLGG